MSTLVVGVPDSLTNGCKRQVNSNKLLLPVYSLVELTFFFSSIISTLQQCSNSHNIMNTTASFWFLFLLKISLFSSVIFIVILSPLHDYFRTVLLFIFLDVAAMQFYCISMFSWQHLLRPNLMFLSGKTNLGQSLHFPSLQCFNQSRYIDFIRAWSCRTFVSEVVCRCALSSVHLSSPYLLICLPVQLVLSHFVLLLCLYPKPTFISIKTHCTWMH